MEGRARIFENELSEASLSALEEMLENSVKQHINELLAMGMYAERVEEIMANRGSESEDSSDSDTEDGSHSDEEKSDVLYEYHSEHPASRGGHLSTTKTQEASTITEAFPQPEAAHAQVGDIEDEEPPTSFFKSLAGGNEEGIEDAKAMWKYFQGKADKFESALSTATYLTCDDMIDNVEVTTNAEDKATTTADRDISDNDNTSKTGKSLSDTCAELLTDVRGAIQQIRNGVGAVDRQTWLIVFLMVIALLSLTLNFVLTIFAIATSSSIL